MLYSMADGSSYVSPDSSFIALSGDLDHARRRELRALLRPANGARSVTLDFSRVTYMDAGALGCFIALRKALPAGGKVRVIHAPLRVTRLFQLVGLDAAFGLSPDAKPSPVGANDAPCNLECPACGLSFYSAAVEAYSGRPCPRGLCDGTIKHRTPLQLLVSDPSERAQVAVTV